MIKQLLNSSNNCLVFEQRNNLSVTTIPLYSEFFRCPVDVFQSKFSRSRISIAVFCLQNFKCLNTYYLHTKIISGKGRVMTF